MFVVNVCGLLIKYVGVCVCVGGGEVLTFVNDNSDSQAAYRQCTVRDSLIGILTRPRSGSSGVRTPTAARDLSALIPGC